MKVIITFTFCRGNLLKNKKNKFKPLEKPGKLREFFFSHCAATLPIYLLLKIKVLSLV